MEEKRKNKKVRKKILIVILILLVIFIALKVYSINIMLKVSDAIDEFNSSTDFAFTEIQQANSVADYKTTIIKKDNIFVTKYTREDNNGESEEITWYDLTSTNKYYNYCSYNLSDTWISYEKKDKENVPYLNDGMPYRIIDFANFRRHINNLNTMEKIKYILTSSFVSTGEYDETDCYTYKIWEITFYIDKETMLPIAETYLEDGVESPLYIIEYNTKYDENILKEPNLSDFNEIGYRDWNEYASNEVPEKPISGTNLNPAESLIENVQLKEYEKLDVLPVSEDTFGVKSVEIDRYDTYSNLREDYSNLRELTEEDFIYYSVVIAYKKGYELNFLEYQETNQSYNIGYVFTEKESENDSLVLIIVPRAQRDNPAIVVSNEKINISAEKIFEIYYSATREIEKELGFEENSLYCNSDKIIKLNHELYKKLNYIKTPIEDGSEPVCWEIKTSVHVQKNDYTNVTTYINALTGEVIGAICWK